MNYSDPQRQLVIQALISMLPYEHFYKRLGSGQKTNAIEAINFHCKGPDFKAKNEEACEEGLEAKKNKLPIDDYDYDFEFVWFIPGVNQKVTMKKSFPSENFEANR